MGFDFGSFLAGAAEQDLENYERRKEHNMEMAKGMLEYRLQNATANRREMQKRVDESVGIARNLMDNYGLTKQQVGVLASQNKLDSFQSVMDEYQASGLDVDDLDFDTLITVTDKQPEPEGALSDYMQQILVGTPSQIDVSEIAGNLYGGDQVDRFGRSLTGDAQRMVDNTLQTVGMTPEELAQYESNQFNPQRVSGQVRMPITKAGAGSDDFRVAVRQISRNIDTTMAQALNVDRGYDETAGGFFYRDTNTNRQAVQTHTMALAGAEVLAGQYMRSGDTYEQANAKITALASSKEGIQQLAGLVAPQPTTNNNNNNPSATSADLPAIRQTIQANPDLMQQFGQEYMRINAMPDGPDKQRAVAELAQQVGVGGGTSTDDVPPPVKDSIVDAMNQLVDRYPDRQDKIIDEYKKFVSDLRQNELGVNPADVTPEMLQNFNLYMEQVLREQ